MHACSSLHRALRCVAGWILHATGSWAFVFGVAAAVYVVGALWYLARAQDGDISVEIDAAASAAAELELGFSSDGSGSEIGIGHGGIGGGDGDGGVLAGDGLSSGPSGGGLHRADGFAALSPAGSDLEDVELSPSGQSRRLDGEKLLVRDGAS